MDEKIAQQNDESALQHFGILGQKWGVRRYQNEDGTLTLAGKRRYYKTTVKIDKKNKKITKFQNKLDKQVYRKSAKAAKMRAKASKLENKALNGWFVSDRRRVELDMKARSLTARADAKMAKATVLQGKIDRAQAYVNRKSQFINQLTEEQIAQGKAYVDSMKR